MEIINVSALGTYKVKVIQFDNGIVMEFPEADKHYAILASIDNGKTWIVCAKNIYNVAVFKSESGLYGEELNSVITTLYRDLKLGEPDEAIACAHYMMIRALHLGGYRE